MTVGPHAIDSELLLVLTPTGRDGALTRDLLDRDGLIAEVCGSIDALCASIDQGAGAALISEEVLTPDAVARLSKKLSEQPPWSDFPLLVFSALGSPARGIHASLRTLGNVTFLDRPVNVRTMLAAVHSALRGRRRQYEARKAIASRDQFLAMLGHELRNPLAAIHLASELLDASPSEVQRQKHRAVIRRQTRHLSRLVDDLLDVARVTNGKVVLREERIDLSEVVRTCFHALDQTAASQGLKYTLCAEAPVEIWGDRVRVEQIFTNLISNAIKYTPSGGSVHVEVSHDDVHATARVIDSGIGIADEMLPLVFDLFAQVDRSLDRAKGGMGLGLTLVRSLVRLHRGTVEAHSEGLGLGSAFRVTFPKLSKREEESKPATEAPPFGSSLPLRIVLVEDNEDIRQLQEELLRSAGHEVWCATDGPSGVEKILSDKPDVAFIDLGLPGFDGFEVARRVRALAGTTVRLIAVSGYGQMEDRARATQAGFDGHLTKPVGLEALSDSMNPIEA